MISGFPSDWALEPECEILMFMWSLVTLVALARFPLNEADVGLIKVKQGGPLGAAA